jgi:hypothetical protein
MTATRRLAAILAANAVGYSQLVGGDGAGGARDSTGSASDRLIAHVCFPHCDVDRRDPQCPVYVDSRRFLKRLKCAKSGPCRTVRQTGNFDPLLPSAIGPVNDREARESGL